MNQIKSILTLPLSCDPSVELIIDILLKDELRVSRSFDLQSACSAFSNNICPKHGKEPCDCQLVVLLVYDQGHLPVSVVLHGHSGKTQLGIADNLGQLAPPGLKSRIQELLSYTNVMKRLKEYVLNAA